MIDLDKINHEIGERQRVDAAFDYVGYLYDENVGWDVLVKTIRSVAIADIYEAERIALRDPRWRDWTTRRIALDPRCAKRARFHIKLHKDRSLISLDNGSVTFSMLAIQ